MGLDGEKYLGLVLPEDDHRPLSLADSSLVVDVAVARAQREAERLVVVEPGTDGTDGGGDQHVGIDGNGDGSAPPRIAPRPTDPGPATNPESTRPTRLYASFDVHEDRPSGRIKKVLDEIAANLRRQPGVAVRLSLEIEAEASAGFDDSTVSTVRENGDVLKLDGKEFE